MYKCIVTGGAGFIGSHLVDKLISLGNKVTCIDNESAKNDSFFWNDKALNVKQDITDFNKIEKYFKNIDFVFHLAAESRIVNAIENPSHTYKVNVLGTENVLKASKKYEIKRFILSSTSSVYGLNEPPNYEEDTKDCLNPYSLSKLFSEQLVTYYCKNHQLPTTILRYFNVFGERAPSNGYYAPVTGIFLRQYKEKKNLTIVGDGSSLRDFIHVDDIISANIVIMTDFNKEVLNDVFNIGFSSNISVKEIADMISNLQTNLPPRAGEAKKTLANTNKIRKVTGWTPKIKISDWIKEQL